jgi:spore germination cell wall hydrolase CwlJ-like protein
MMANNVRPKGLFALPFGLSIFIFAVTPSQIGYQDLGSLVARQPAVTAHWRQHIRASAFGTIHAATFSFSRPIGTTMPQPLSHRLASLDPRMVMPAPWDDSFVEEDEPQQLQFPTVNRSVKVDRLPVLNPSQPALETAKAEEAPVASSAPAEPVTTPVAEPAATAAPPTEVASVDPSQPVVTTSEEQPAAALETESTPEASEAVENTPVDIPDPVDTVVAEADVDFTFALPEPVDPTMEMARLYFGHEPLGDELGTIEKWAPGEEPIIVAPTNPATSSGTDMKQSALDRNGPADANGGESIAPKGEVTGEGKRPITPAERLNLDGKDRTKAEKCLADAVYFESRGEPVRGQIAVAQVVMNRVFSGFYPRNVCATVYQNKHRRLACQFTFACDGIPDVVTEPHAWVRATLIARDVLDGKYWVQEVNRATHYHAYWVRPSWVREMKRLYKFGVHTFYRPRRWGDGADMPSWGTAAATSEAIAKL